MRAYLRGSGRRGSPACLPSCGFDPSFTPDPPRARPGAAWTVRRKIPARLLAFLPERLQILAMFFGLCYVVLKQIFWDFQAPFCLAFHVRDFARLCSCRHQLYDLHTPQTITPLNSGSTSRPLLGRSTNRTLPDSRANKPAASAAPAAYSADRGRFRPVPAWRVGGEAKFPTPARIGAACRQSTGTGAKHARALLPGRRAAGAWMQTRKTGRDAGSASLARRRPYSHDRRFRP